MADARAYYESAGCPMPVGVSFVDFALDLVSPSFAGHQSDRVVAHFVAHQSAAVLAQAHLPAAIADDVMNQVDPDGAGISYDEFAPGPARDPAQKDEARPAPRRHAPPKPLPTPCRGPPS